MRVSPALSTEGYFTLNWHGDARLLQQSSDADFQKAAERRLSTADQALTLSGFADGVYHFRAGAGDGKWSEPVSVEVRHPALSRALAFFLLGFGLFAVLALSILHGHRRSRAGGRHAP